MTLSYILHFNLILSINDIATIYFNVLLPAFYKNNGPFGLPHLHLLFQTNLIKLFFFLNFQKQQIHAPQMAM